jgi:hypothetical protein
MMKLTLGLWYYSSCTGRSSEIICLPGISNFEQMEEGLLWLVVFWSSCFGKD